MSTPRSTGHPAVNKPIVHRTVEKVWEGRLDERSPDEQIELMCDELLKSVPGAHGANVADNGEPGYDGWVEVGEVGAGEGERGVGFAVNPDGSIRLFRFAPHPDDPYDWSNDRGLVDGPAGDLLQAARDFLSGCPRFTSIDTIPAGMVRPGHIINAQEVFAQWPEAAPILSPREALPGDDPIHGVQYVTVAAVRHDGPDVVVLDFAGGDFGLMSDQPVRIFAEAN